MNKKAKILTGIVGMTILSGVIVVGGVNLKNKQNQIPQSAYEEIIAQANVQINEALAKQKTELENECNIKLNGDKDKLQVISHYDLLNKYYEGSSTEGLLVEEMTNTNGIRNYSLKFNEGKVDKYIEDVDYALEDDVQEKLKDTVKHSYSVQQLEYENTQTGITKYNTVIGVTFEKKHQFDIKKCALLRAYIDQLIERNLTDDEMSMLNVATNSGTDSLASIKDLEKYTSTIENGLNIDGVNIKPSFELDSVTGSYTATFIITKNLDSN